MLFMRDDVIDDGDHLGMFVLLMILQMVPKQGAMKGIQNLTITRSGLQFSDLPADPDPVERIDAELTVTLMGMSSGRFGGILGFPGKRKPGILQAECIDEASSPRLRYSRISRSL